MKSIIEYVLQETLCLTSNPLCLLYKERHQVVNNIFTCDRLHFVKTYAARKLFLKLQSVPS